MSAPAAKIAPWEDIVLRIIAIYKLIHGAFFTAVGFGLLKLRHHDVVEFLNVHVILPYHLNPEDRLVDWLLTKAATVNPHMLVLAGWTFFFYAALFFAEGIGLYLRKHWAEYMVVIVTASLLPLEIWELCQGLALWKFAAVIANLAIVSYLVHRLRLDARNRAAADQVENPPKTGPPSSARPKPVPSEVP